AERNAQDEALSDERLFAVGRGDVGAEEPRGFSSAEAKQYEIPGRTRRSCGPSSPWGESDLQRADRVVFLRLHRPNLSGGTRRLRHSFLEQVPQAWRLLRSPTQLDFAPYSWTHSWRCGNLDAAADADSGEQGDPPLDLRPRSSRVPRAVDHGGPKSSMGCCVPPLVRRRHPWHLWFAGT